MTKIQTDEQNVRRFMQDLIVDAAHKAALKKSKLIERAQSPGSAPNFWKLTPKGRKVAQRLGLL